jgi:hypothetical protein
LTLNALEQPLCCICQIIVISQPAAVDAVETIASLNFPITSGFPHLGGMQDIQLTICWEPQDIISCPARNSSPQKRMPTTHFARNQKTLDYAAFM